MKINRLENKRLGKKEGSNPMTLREEIAALQKAFAKHSVEPATNGSIAIVLGLMESIAKQVEDQGAAICGVASAVGVLAEEVRPPRSHD